MKTKAVLGWWCSGANGLTAKMEEHNMSPARVGYTHRFKGVPVVCKQGLHITTYFGCIPEWSRGPLLWRVRLSGKLTQNHLNKQAGCYRKYLWNVTPEQLRRVMIKVLLTRTATLRKLKRVLPHIDVEKLKKHLKLSIIDIDTDADIGAFSGDFSHMSPGLMQWLLTGKKPDVFLVGSFDQCIYQLIEWVGGALTAENIIIANCEPKKLNKNRNSNN